MSDDNGEDVALDGKLVELAMELGITAEEIEGFGSNEALNRRVQTKTKEIAKAAARAFRGETEDEEQARGAFDEVMGSSRGVMVRVVEWTDWIPSFSSEHMPSLFMQNGFTGFEAGENEKVVDISVSRTGQVKEVKDPDAEDPERSKQFYALYAFQATLAQNVRTDLISDFMEIQGGDREGTTVKGAGSAAEKLIRPNGAGGGPNRAQRRHG